jgi:hypothetical protein
LLATANCPAEDNLGILDITSKSSKSEIGLALASPVNSLAFFETRFQFRTFEGSLPESDDRDSMMFHFTPGIAWRFDHGGALLLKTRIPYYLDQPLWRVNFDDPIWELDRDYPDFLLRQSPQVTASTGEFYAGHDHMGDIELDLGYANQTSSGYFWAAGGTAVLRTSTDISGNRDQVLLSPDLALGKYHKEWVLGARLQHFLDVSGDTRFNTQETHVKIFFAHNLANGWQLTSNPTILYDWEADSGNEWLIPLGAGLAKVFTAGSIPFRLEMEAQYYVKSAERFGTDWLLQFTLTPVFANPWGE